MTLSGMGPSLAVEGATTRAVFEAYVEEALAPSLHPGQVVVMDNLTAHKGERVRELIEEQVASWFSYHPTHPTSTPSSKPSEEVKEMLRGAEARTSEALIEAIGRALSAVTATDVSGFFGHATTGQRPNCYDSRSRSRRVYTCCGAGWICRIMSGFIVLA